MVVLKSLIDNYDDYKKVLSDSHTEIAGKLNDGLSEDERIKKGDDMLASICSIYENSDDDTKTAIRSQFKQWLLAAPDEKDKEWNEAEQLKILNEYLSAGTPPMSLEQADLDYIRYTLTQPGQEMSEVEYCAYAWNKGTEESGMKLDRLLADKIGTILADPENFDYDQFTVNVSTLAEKYAQQSVNDGGYIFDNVFEEIT